MILINAREVGISDRIDNFTIIEYKREISGKYVRLKTNLEWDPKDLRVSCRRIIDNGMYNYVTFYWTIT